jgi:hypothetical protein
VNPGLGDPRSADSSFIPESQSMLEANSVEMLTADSIFTGLPILPTLGLIKRPGAFLNRILGDADPKRCH